MHTESASTISFSQRLSKVWGHSFGSVHVTLLSARVHEGRWTAACYHSAKFSTSPGSRHLLSFVEFFKKRFSWNGGIVWGRASRAFQFLLAVSHCLSLRLLYVLRKCFGMAILPTCFDAHVFTRRSRKQMTQISTWFGIVGDGYLPGRIMPKANGPTGFHWLSWFFQCRSSTFSELCQRVVQHIHKILQQ